MKNLLSMTVVIGIVGLLVAPGLARDPRHSGQEFYGHSARWQYVEIEFVHDTFYDVPLWPDPSNRGALEEIPGSGQLCQAVHVPGAELTGDVEGFNVLLSDLFCISADFTKARVEATGFIISDDRR